MSADLPFNAEAIAAALAHTAAAQGDAASVAALAVAVPRLMVTGEGRWIDNELGAVVRVSLYLEMPAEAFGQLFRVREEVQERILAMYSPMIDAYREFEAAQVFIVLADTPPYDWRKQALAWLHGEGITNQGRVRSDNIAAREYDGLLFRSRQEINLYCAFKAAGVTFAPLPVFVRGGKEYRRIEPDFIVVKGGMVAMIEVDGDTVHRESPAEAHARTSMLAYEGAHVERVKASDCDTPEKAKGCADRILAILARVRASR